MAYLNGDPNPQSGEVFSTTHQTAERVISASGVNTNQPVFAVVLRGKFVGYTAYTPDGKFPAGNAMNVVFDANSLAITDWGLLSTVPDLAALGASTSLHF